MERSIIVLQCTAMLDSGASNENVVCWLRENEISKMQSVFVMAEILHVPLQQAKELVHLSDTWKDRRAVDEAFNEMVEEALDTLASEEEPDPTAGQQP